MDYSLLRVSESADFPLSVIFMKRSFLIAPFFSIVAIPFFIRWVFRWWFTVVMSFDRICPSSRLNLSPFLCSLIVSNIFAQISQPNASDSPKFFHSDLIYYKLKRYKANLFEIKPIFCKIFER